MKILDNFKIFHKFLLFTVICMFVLLILFSVFTAGFIYQNKIISSIIKNESELKNQTTMLYTDFHKVRAVLQNIIS